LIGSKKPPQATDAIMSPFDEPVAQSRKNKKSREKNVFAKKPKATRPLRSTAQTEAIKVTRLRRTVFAVVLVVVGFIGVLVANTGKTPNYAYLTLKQYVPAGSKVTANQINVEIAHSPIVGALSEQQLSSNILLQNGYPGTILTSSLFTNGKNVPNGDVLIGISLGANHEPTTPIAIGSHVALFVNSQNTVTAQVGSKTVTFTNGQTVTNATVVFYGAGTSGNATAFDLAVPPQYAGAITSLAAFGDLSIGQVA